MSLNTILKIVFSQLRKKWGRTILSSLGIMIGVWAILSTVSLSEGVSDKVITAVNSQSLVRLVQFYKTNPQIKSFEDFGIDTQFVNSRYNAVEDSISEIEEISSFNPSDTMSVYIHDAESNPECVNTGINQLLDEANTRPTELSGCYELNTLLQPFDLFLANNEANWYGSKTEPGENEIAVCYQCNEDDPLYTRLGAENPQDLVNQTITLEFKDTPSFGEAGSEVNFANAAISSTSIKQSVPRTFTITGVYDDREDSLDLAGSFLSSFGYLNYQEYLKALEQNEVPTGNLGYLEFNVFLSSFEDLDKVVELLRNRDFLVISLGQIISSSIKTAFDVLTISLGVFAMIVLIAALFGIINVMTISVLEREKEIGILKSLGSSNNDIFLIFMLESILLGIFGWLFGVILTWTSNGLISSGFNTLLLSDEQIKDSLASLNITDFNLIIPSTILFATLGLAVLFTAISGLTPALNASWKNPTEVLRSE